MERKKVATKKKGRQKNGGPRKYVMRTRDEVLQLIQDMQMKMLQNPDICDIRHITHEFNISRSTFYDWKKNVYKEDEEIQHAYNLLEDISTTRLEKGGLSANTNPYFTAFLLKTRYQYAETNKVDVNAEVKHSGEVGVRVVVESSGQEINI